MRLCVTRRLRRRNRAVWKSQKSIARWKRWRGRAGGGWAARKDERVPQSFFGQTGGNGEGALQDLGEAALEYKFDGARVQVHRSGEDVRVFSRALNDVTPAVPEIVEAARKMPGRDLILEGEVLSLTPQERPQPFQ